MSAQHPILPCGCNPAATVAYMCERHFVERHRTKELLDELARPLPGCEDYTPREYLGISRDQHPKRRRGIVASREETGTPTEVWTGTPPGLMQGFASGATRGSDDGKIDYEGHINPDALRVFGEYMNSHRTQADGAPRASDNWQKGIPPHKYVKSLIRHTIDFWRAWRGTITHNPDTGKPQQLCELLGAIFFNVQGLILELDRAGALYTYYVPTAVRQAGEAPQGAPSCE